jgi:hypothetical protein
VIREFTDDHVRRHLAGLSDEEAWEALRPLTELGASLAHLNVKVDIPRDIPYLGIKRGRLDLQRFFYWHICKAYYRPEFTAEENNHVNFDWFRPLNCHRQTPEEVRGYCRVARLAITHMDVQEAGITVVGRRSRRPR